MIAVTRDRIGPKAGQVEFAREAEFEKPLNERRMRYRRLTLVPRLRPE